MKHTHDIEKAMMMIATKGMNDATDRKTSLNQIIQAMKELEIKGKEIKSIESQLYNHNELILKHEEKMADLITK